VKCLLTASIMLAVLGVGCSDTVRHVGAGGGSTGTDDSTSTGTGMGTGGGASTATSSATSTETSTSTGTDSETGTDTGTATSVNDVCWDQFQTGCTNCCDDMYQPELEIIWDLIFDWCFCNPGAPCQIACEAHCVDLESPADPPCQACMDGVFADSGNDDCIFSAAEVCFTQPDCAPYLECFEGC